MEKNGFLTRESDKDDARKKRLVPTAKAEELRGLILEDIKRNEKMMVEGIKKKMSQSANRCYIMYYKIS